MSKEFFYISNWDKNNSSTYSSNPTKHSKKVDKVKKGETEVGPFYISETEERKK